MPRIAVSIKAESRYCVSGMTVQNRPEYSPAFQDDIHQEGRMEDFDKAIEDTLIALNTGVLRT